MNKLIAIVSASGVGKTTLTHALARAHPFQTAYEQHSERPFQKLFKQDARYALANQMDYLLFRAEQERELRASSQTALVDGGLDLDFHGFTRLFHARGLLTDPEYDLCRRFYSWTRNLLPLPDLIIHLTASREIIKARLAQRDRINIASAEDTELFNSFLEEWLETISPHQILHLDVSNETPEYSQSIPIVLERLQG
ncbi:MAG: deoxynucleoside kinase [Chloroflexi bacterium]|nr:deoxynucleoside kinase [Chloroflexota bacterium]